MPAAVAVKGAIIVVTVVAAAAIAVYESPEVRQFAEQCRRRIAVALHSLGDEISPRSESETQGPRYNRPEDAEGFSQSIGGDGVDADEESRRRQREELMYWNKIRMEKLERDKKQNTSENRTGGVSFDDFLREDSSAEGRTYVYNSGTEMYISSGRLLHHRGLRELDRGDPFANPFADENQIEIEEQRATDQSLISPEASEILEDIYSATDDMPSRSSTRTILQDQLIDVSEPATEALTALPELVSEPISYPTIQELPTDFYPQDRDAVMVGQGQDCQMAKAYASIHAWANNNDPIHTYAHDASASFYSPLPTTPATPLSVTSEPEELIGIDRQATPTDSASLAGSGEDTGKDDFSSVADIISEDGDGMHTPGSWTEIGSVVSESEAGVTEAF